MLFIFLSLLVLPTLIQPHDDKLHDAPGHPVICTPDDRKRIYACMLEFFYEDENETNHIINYSTLYHALYSLEINQQTCNRIIHLVMCITPSFYCNEEYQPEDVVNGTELSYAVQIMLIKCVRRHYIKKMQEFKNETESDIKEMPMCIKKIDGSCSSGVKKVGDSSSCKQFDRFTMMILCEVQTYYLPGEIANPTFCTKIYLTDEVEGTTEQAGNIHQ